MIGSPEVPNGDFDSSNPTFADDGEFGEDRTAVVHLNELRVGRRAVRDRHLLVRVHGAQLGQVVRLEGRELRVGRQQDCDIWLDDGGISRRHANILPQGGGYLLEDLRSANGTFVHGQRVERHLLQDGDVIQFGPTVVVRYSITDAEQEALLRQLYAASVTDSLTGTFNREHFDTRLSAELSYARRHKSEVSLVLLDIDHFKNINDTYGHQAGDAVLVGFASAVNRTLRSEDVFARYGGEEFAIILRNIDLAGAERVGHRLRIAIEKLRITHEGREIRVTTSVGCAAFSEDPEMTQEGLIAAADRRLYAAKHAGRNRVVARD